MPCWMTAKLSLPWDCRWRLAVTMTVAMVVVVVVVVVVVGVAGVIRRAHARITACLVMMRLSCTHTWAPCLLPPV